MHGLCNSGGGRGNDKHGSREKHRSADVSKVYSRKSFKKSSKSSLNSNPHPPPSSSSNRTLTPATAAKLNSSRPPPSRASGDDSSSLNLRPEPNPSANRQRRFVTISLASRPKHEVRELRRKLTFELDQIRAVARRIEARENYHPPSHSPDHAATEPASTASLSQQLSMSVPENSANQHYSRPPGFHSHKKPKSDGSKMGLVDTKLYDQAFKSCSLLLSELMKHKHGPVFNTPVDVRALRLRDYFAIVKHPMDLGTVKTRLSKNWYKTPEEFAEDVRLTFRNAMTYNPKGEDVHAMAEQLLQIFEKQWTAIEAEYTHISMSQPPSSVSTKRPPIDTEKVLERSNSVVNPMPMGPKAKPVSFTPQVERRSALKKPNVKDADKRDMTLEEKQKLSSNLQSLPPEKLESIVLIVKKRNSSLSEHDEEIEVDINNMDIDTLWELDNFVTNCKKSLSKKKRKTELTVIADAGIDCHEGSRKKVQERNPDPIVAVMPKENGTERT